MSDNDTVSGDIGNDSGAEVLTPQQVEEVVGDVNKVMAYDEITDSTIVLGSTTDGEAMVVVLGGEDTSLQANAPSRVLTARHASDEELRLYQERAATT